MNKISKDKIQFESLTLKTMENTYKLVEWPYSQELMDKSWFDECSLAEIKFGKAAYFVPLERYIELKDIID